MRGWPGLVFALAMAALLPGCYDQPKPSCTFSCATSGACPDDYACSPDDGLCHLVLPGGGMATCEDLLPDGSTDDAPVDAPTDAEPDASVDAPADAQVDARVDARVDAHVDAGVPDAAVADASVPDAGAPDAGAPDADTTPDA